MTGKERPAGRDNDDEMIAESRLDYLLDKVEAPEPSVMLRNRVHDLGAGLVRLPPRTARPRQRTNLMEWLREWFGGSLLRPAAVAGALVIGIALGHALPTEKAAAPESGGTAITSVVPPAPQILVTASLASQSAGPDALSVQGYSLVMPRATLLSASELADSGDESGVGSLPLY